MDVAEGQPLDSNHPLSGFGPDGLPLGHVTFLFSFTDHSICPCLDSCF